MSDTVFKQVNYDLSTLLNFIELGEIGLPDIQRPFVWPNAKVRDLFDSMYRGYPVGYLLFWQNYSQDGQRIGVDAKQKFARLLIVDGQQRLTSLFAVVKGRKVVRDDYSEEMIEIAFNPLQEKFEVTDAAIKKDKAYLPNISRLWNKETDIFEVVDTYLTEVSKSREITPDDERQIKRAISKLAGLSSFPFTALELASQVDEQQVAEVFVRINSKGTPLNQADFILTLMSVFWDDGRSELESFCRESRKPGTGPSPFNHFIQPDPDQLLRAAVALGFKRARLTHVYSILRGKDLATGDFSDERRDEQFSTLKVAQSRVLNLTYWHDFFKAIMLSGHRSARTITSNAALIYTYALYLIGRTEYKVDEHRLRRVVARWFFMASITARYSGSPESTMEFDLARLRDTRDAEEFVSVLDKVCDDTLTSDFWSITLPNDLATSSPRSPSLFAYYAALVLLEARVLFSQQRVADMLDPSIQAKKSAVERHHLFPRGYLQGIGINELRETNQIANYTLLEWGDNIDISKKSPADYLKEYVDRLPANTLKDMYYWHALPDGWEQLEYQDFLVRRRELMGKLIATAYAKLSAPDDGTTTATSRSIAELVAQGETLGTEFKSALRKNLHTGQHDARIELAVVKTVAGFLNTQGGTLVVGVSDDGVPVGIGVDDFSDEDKMHQHLVNLVRDRIGPQFLMYVHSRFEEFDGTRVFKVECYPSNSPAFVKDGAVGRFFVRGGVTTLELSGGEEHQFIAQRFG